jgi:hypothetical protein
MAFALRNQPQPDGLVGQLKDKLRPCRVHHAKLIPWIVLGHRVFRKCASNR